MKKGFSLVEIMVSIAIFGVFVASFFYYFDINRKSHEKVLANDKAVNLASEGIEAVRNIRDKDFNELLNGTWGLSTTSNVWNLESGTDIFDIFQREIIISEVDSQTKKIESKVSYNVFGATSTVSLISYLTYWQEFYQNIGDWSTILKDSFLSLTGGLKIAYSGDYSYVITGTSLRVYNISDPNSPSFVNSYTQTGTLTNIFINGDYVYMTSTGNNHELQIRNISNPNSLGATIIVNLPSTNDANGIYVSNNKAFVLRNFSAGVANFTILDVSVLPSVPTTLGSFTLNSENLFEAYNSGNYVYVSSSGDTSELRILNVTNPNVVTSTSINLIGGTGGAATTNNAGAVSGDNNYLYITQGLTNSSTYLFDISNPSTPTLSSQINLSGIVNDISIGNGGKYAWLGTNLINQELIVLEGSLSPQSLTILGSYNATTSQSFLGVSYHSIKDRLIAVSNYVAEGFIILKPN